MANIDRGFDIDSLALSGRVLHIAGELVPPVSGFEAPIGSVYTCTAAPGLSYKKFGAGDNDWKVNDDALVVTPLTLWVTVAGSDVSGDGSLTFPFLTVKKAMDTAALYPPSAVAPVRVMVGPGTYPEQPFTIPDYTTLELSSANLVTVAPTLDFVTAGHSCLIKGGSISGVTTSGKYCLVISGPTNAQTTVLECQIGYASSCAVKVTGSGAYFTAYLSSVGIFGVTESGVFAGNNSNVVISNSGIIGNGYAAVGVETSGNATAIVSGQVNYFVKGIRHNSTGMMQMVSPLSIGTGCVISVEKVGLSPITSRAVDLEGEKLLGTDIEHLYGSFYDTSQGAVKLRVADEFSVGFPGRGVDSVFGEGSPYVNGMYVFGYNGVTFTNLTTEARSTGGTPFGFPGVTAGNMIYISSLRAHATTKAVFPFPGVSVHTSTAAVGGEIILEIWNGSAWVETNGMVLASDTDLGGRPYAKQYFQRIGREEVNFDKEAPDVWVTSDPMSLGLPAYWCRFRILTGLTTNPQFTKILIQTDRTEIVANGRIHYHGKGRLAGLLPIDSGVFNAANNSPSSSDVYLSVNLGVGRTENNFSATNRNRSSIVVPLPSNIDTSCKVVMKAFMFMESSYSGNIVLVVRTATSTISSVLASTSGTAPASAVGEQSITKTVTPPATGFRQFEEEFDLDLSDILTVHDDGSREVLWLSLERNGSNAADTHTGRMVLIQVEVKYTMWAPGGRG